MKNKPPTLVKNSSGQPRETVLRTLFTIAPDSNRLQYVTPSGKSLGIAEVQDLRKWLSCSGQSNFIIVFPEFEKTTREAQNALLKLLEDFAERYSFILITTMFDAVLPTIQSRCRHMSIDPMSSEIVSTPEYETLIEAAHTGNAAGFFSHQSASVQSLEDAEAFFSTLLPQLYNDVHSGDRWATSASAVALELFSLVKNNNLNAQLAVDLWFMRAQA